MFTRSTDLNMFLHWTGRECYLDAYARVLYSLRALQPRPGLSRELQRILESLSTAELPDVYFHTKK